MYLIWNYIIYNYENENKFKNIQILDLLLKNIVNFIKKTAWLKEMIVFTNF